MITTHHITEARARRPERRAGLAPARERAHHARNHKPVLTHTHQTTARGRLHGEDVAQLVRAAAAGEHHAWEGLVEEFAGLVWAVARGHRLSDADAADVSQATWLKLFERLDDIQDPTRVGAWLATTARRECLRVLRLAQRHVLSGEDAGEYESPEMTPDAVLLLAERDQALWGCFEGLRPRDQTLLRLLMADPQPAYEEISAALEMPIGSIGPTRARALERLRQDLESTGSLALVAG